MFFLFCVQRDIQLERAAAAVGEPAAGDGQQRATAHRVSPHRHKNDQHRGHDAPADGLGAHAPSPQAQQHRRSVNLRTGTAASTCIACALILLDTFVCPDQLSETLFNTSENIFCRLYSQDFS
jgi:hypothetical protein